MSSLKWVYHLVSIDSLTMQSASCKSLVYNVLRWWWGGWVVRRWRAVWGEGCGWKSILSNAQSLYMRRPALSSLTATPSPLVPPYSLNRLVEPETGAVNLHKVEDVFSTIGLEYIGSKHVSWPAWICGTACTLRPCVSS